MNVENLGGGQQAANGLSGQYRATGDTAKASHTGALHSFARFLLPAARSRYRALHFDHTMHIIR